MPSKCRAKRVTFKPIAVERDADFELEPLAEARPGPKAVTYASTSTSSKSRIGDDTAEAPFGESVAESAPTVVGQRGIVRPQLGSVTTPYGWLKLTHKG
jgi:hypothetical protein